MLHVMFRQRYLHYNGTYPMFVNSFHERHLQEEEKYFKNILSDKMMMMMMMMINVWLIYGVKRPTNSYGQTEMGPQFEVSS